MAMMIISTGLVLQAGCKKDEGTPRDGTGDGGGGGAWLVGQDGTMINVSPTTSKIGGYDLDADEDLLDIACRGADTAWVVGEGGTLLRTTDRGESWQAIDLSTTRTLRTVAASEGEVVYIAGDGGLMLRSGDSGDSWTDVVGATDHLTAAATAHDGQVALFGDSAGGLWLWDGALVKTHQSEAAVHGISMSADGRTAIAVGDAGMILRSLDGGQQWQPIDASLAGALRDVWVTGDGSSALAVGDGALLVEIDQAGVTTRELIADGPTLRGIHLAADGSGMAVGDSGTGLVTTDHGASWTQVELGTVRTLHAVDDIHDVPHF
jgi:photosystem II stability/assembly factor-like uncharacterized protein